MKNHYWIFPLIILVLLLIAPYFRWEYTATKTTDSPAVVYKWRTDRWTGEIWQENYSTRGSVTTNRAAVNTGRLTSVQATRLWDYTTALVLVGTILSWAVPIIKSRKKKEPLKE